MQANRFDEAAKALDALSKADPVLYRAPATQLLAGLSYYRTDQFALAMKSFSATAGPPASADDRAAALSNVFMAAVLLSQGKDDAAVKYLSTTEVQSAIRSDPKLVQRSIGALGHTDARLTNAIKGGEGKM